MIDLIEAKRRAGLRGYAIAEELGVTSATVSRWLNRKDDIPSRYVRRLAALLRVDPLDLLPRETQET